MQYWLSSDCCYWTACSRSRSRSGFTGSGVHGFSGSRVHGPRVHAIHGFTVHGFTVHSSQVHSSRSTVHRFHGFTGSRVHRCYGRLLISAQRWQGVPWVQICLWISSDNIRNVFGFWLVLLPVIYYIKYIYNNKTYKYHYYICIYTQHIFSIIWYILYIILLYIYYILCIISYTYLLYGV